MKAPRRKQTLKRKVLAHARSGAEARETAADERRESPAFQRAEKRYGVELHKERKR